MKLRDIQEHQQNNQMTVYPTPVGAITAPDIQDGLIFCRLCDQAADSDYVEQDIFICARCADLVANTYSSDCGRSTYGFASWDREALVKPSKNTRPKIPAGLRNTVFKRDGYQCINCGALDHLCVDHITPVSKGGGDESANLQTLCIKCNSSKGAKTMKEWRGK